MFTLCWIEGITAYSVKSAFFCQDVFLVVQ